MDLLKTPPAIVGEQVAGRAAQVRKQLILLSNDVKANTLDLAELLVEAKREGYPKKWGYEGIADFGKNELGLKERKVFYLMRIVEVCEAVGVKRADYEKVAISSLREITTLDPEEKYYNRETNENEDMAEHIVRLLADAPDMEGKEVADEVARLKGMTDENAMITRSHRWTVSAYENVIKKAIEQMRMHLGSKGRDPDTGKAVEYSDSQCLEDICLNFLADPNYNQTPVPTEPQIDEYPTGPQEVPTEL